MGKKYLFLLVLIFLVTFVFAINPIQTALEFLATNGTEVNLNSTITQMNVTRFNQTWLDFDGVDDLINMDFLNYSNNTIEGEHSISFNYRLNSKSNFNAIGGNIDNEWIRLDSSSPQKLSWRIYNDTLLDTIIFPVSPTLDVWYNVVLTYSGSRMKGYLDGIYTINNNEGDVIGMKSSTNNFKLGTLSTSFLNGSISEFKVWDKTLSLSQATQIYNESVIGNNLGQRIPIIMYHCVGSQHEPACSGPSSLEFTAHMDYLYSEGYNSVTLKNVTDWINGIIELPKKSFVLTFDDAWSSCIDVAYPIMSNLGFVGVVGTPSNYVGMNVNRTSYENLTTLINAGWEIASHSISHSAVNFSNISYIDGFNEMNLSKFYLEQNLSDYLVTSWIYPFNEHNSTWDSICGTIYSLCTGDANNENFNTYRSYSLTGGIVRISPNNNIEIFKTRLNLEDDLKLVLSLNENTGITAYDISGNENDGVITGATWDNDGNNIPLTEDTDYTLDSSNGIFILINSDYDYSYIFLDYIYDNDEIGDTGGGTTGDILIDVYAITNLSLEVCELTYGMAQNENYDDINDIIEIMNLKGETYLWTDIKTYIDNWQTICSDEINKTLSPELICSKLYYFILGNSYDYDLNDLNDLKKEIELNQKISLELLQDYLDNYDSKCYSLGLSEKLPKKPGETVTFDFSKITECNETIGLEFFDLYIPFGKISLGNPDCNSIDFWRWIFRLEKIEDNYYLIGIKIYLLAIALLIILASTLLSNKWRRKT